LLYTTASPLGVAAARDAHTSLIAVVRKTAVGPNGCNARLLLLLLLLLLLALNRRQRQYVVVAVSAWLIAASVHVNVDCRSIFSCSYCYVGRLHTKDLQALLRLRCAGGSFSATLR
jgi:hypothetical protein